MSSFGKQSITFEENPAMEIIEEGGALPQDEQQEAMVQCKASQQEVKLKRKVSQDKDFVFYGQEGIAFF